MKPRDIYQPWTATMPDGTELLIQVVLDFEGRLLSMTAATRPEPDPAIIWGPPTPLVKRGRR